MKRFALLLAAAGLIAGCAYDGSYEPDAHELGNGPGGAGMYPGTAGPGTGSAHPGGYYGTGAGSATVTPAPSGPGSATRPSGTDVVPGDTIPEPAPILPDAEDDLD